MRRLCGICSSFRVKWAGVVVVVVWCGGLEKGHKELGLKTVG